MILCLCVSLCVHSLMFDAEIFCCSELVSWRAFDDFMLPSCGEYTIVGIVGSIV